MSWQTPREQAFRITGPFIIKRDGHAGDLELKHGDVVDQAQLHAAGVTDRVLQRMYAAHWMDMAADEAPVMDATEQHARHLASKLEAAAAALQPRNAPETGLAGDTGEGHSHDTQKSAEALSGPENGPGGDQAAEAAVAAQATEGGAAGVEGQPTAPTDTVVVTYKHTGFGKFFAFNAAGEQLGDKPLTKTQAIGLANSAQVPVLGQNGQPIADE